MVGENTKQSIVAVSGKYIQLPAFKEGQSGWGNLSIPSPYEEESGAKYPIATKFVDGDRRWHYIQHGSALTRGRVCYSHNAYGTATSGDGTTRETGTIQAAALIDATTIYCTDQGSATPANVFAGGYAMIYWEFLCLRIKSNTAEDDPSAGIFGVTFDNPLPVAIDAASVVSLYRDKYADVRYSAAGTVAGFNAGVAVPAYTRTDLYYSWGQTWGPCGLAGTDNIGATAGERGITRMHDGSVFTTSGIHASNNQPLYQYIGYLIPYTGPGPTGQDQPGAFIHVELQLAP